LTTGVDEGVNADTVATPVAAATCGVIELGRT
jgi:hypothetical protein